MWIILRFLFAAVVYAVRFLWRRKGVEGSGTFREARWVVRTVRGKKGRVSRLYCGFEYAVPLPFVLTRERAWDRWFKALGLAHEVQTGDARFDGRVYVACDHPLFPGMLAREAAAREAIVTLLANGVDRIFTDGVYVWATLKTDAATPREQELAALYVLREALGRLDPTAVRLHKDPFVWKALAIEAGVWSLAFYAVPGFFELLAHPATLYPQVGGLVTLSLAVTAAIFAGLFLTIVLMLRGSSRGHRVIVESALLLAVGVPLFSLQAVSDVNIRCDESPPQMVDAQVARKVVQVRRGRRGRTSRAYYLHLASAVESGEGVDSRMVLPERLKVGASLYGRVRERGTLRVTSRRGALGLPWIESIEAGR